MIYFASDVHLGLKFGRHSTTEREKIFVAFLNQIEPTCDELFLLGDIFDFWFEWNRTVPQGFVRVLAKLAHMTDRGITIHFFTGNHDLWVGDYLKNEIGLTIHFGEFVVERQNKKLFLAHGDTFYRHKAVSRILEKILRSNSARWIGQRLIHPDALVRFGMKWSLSNRQKRGGVAHVFGGEDDFLVNFARGYLSDHQHIDYFVFGHQHTPVKYPLSDRCNLFILGEWVENPFYAVLDNGSLSLQNFIYHSK